MFRKLLCVVPPFAFFALAALAPASATAQERDRHPRLHAALTELREARKELVAATDNWPPGNKERALAAIDDAIKSVKTILSVKGDDFRGLDRGADYYKRFKDHPRLRSALQDLRDARDELRAAKADFGNMKERTLDDIEIAIGHIVALMRR